MFERYDEPARRSLFFARYEANLFGRDAIEAEHLLLGILKEREPLIAHLLRQWGVSGDAIRQRIYERNEIPASRADLSLEIPFSTDARRVLACAAEEADRLLHGDIAPVHLLLGLLRLEQGIAWDVLLERGLGLTPVRDALDRHAGAPPPLPPDVEHPRRSEVVYLMTALDHPSPGRRIAANDTGASRVSSFSTTELSARADTGSIGPLSLRGITLPAFVLLVESFLDRPVLDGTGLIGMFDIELPGKYQTADALIAALRNQAGLALTRGL